MERSWYWKSGIVAIVAVYAILYSLPSIVDPDCDPAAAPEIRSACEKSRVLPDWYTKIFSRRVTLGLDLKGGMHLIYTVKVDKAIEDRVDGLTGEMQAELVKKGAVVEKAARRPGSFKVDVKLKEAAKSDEATKIFDSDNYRYFFFVSRSDTAKGTFELTPKEDFVDDLRKKSVDQAMERIRDRVDKLGLTEPQITKLTGTEIQVQLPGVREGEHAKELIGQPAQLEFKICDDTKDFFGSVDKPPEGIEKRTEGGSGEGAAPSLTYLVAKEKSKLAEFVKTLTIGDDHQVAFGPYNPRDEAEEDEEEGAKKGAGTVQTAVAAKMYRTYFMHRKVQMTGETITDASVRQDSSRQSGLSNRPYVSLEFNRRGAREFEKITGENVQRRMAIVLDDEVNSAPVIKSRIGGGRAQIELGSYKSPDALIKEAKDLALVLKSGALPAPIQLQEERRIEATLGKASVEKGMWAFLVGLAAVFLFMIVYYRGSGVIANVGLFLNAVFLFSVMIAAGATLTLPGIAGIVLTVGMAVDANILINERIREELHAGKTARAAVEAGYSRVFWTIFDSNVTTAIAAMMCWQYGTGPVRGFGVTLLIGLSVSMFTAIVVTRLIYVWVLSRRRAPGLSI
ncbi:MAG: protein translocase subunit SecD [Deltaproteobacteria bacterium]|nr:protein translocase subunit SecD [Deltaproteobacteria bacterium]